MGEHSTIVIVDYGMGNLVSVRKAFKRVGYEVLISSNASDILKADKLVLPGVGHFKSGMEHLKERNLIPALHLKVVQERTPILGICLGMQLMTEFSEEGNVEGLGWFAASTIRFNQIKNKQIFRIPHMGWNTIRLNGNASIFKKISDDALFYFVHSYHVVCTKEEEVAASTDYGITFTSSIHKNNIYGVQFHPEKSHDNGLLILKNFATIPTEVLAAEKDEHIN